MKKFISSFLTIVLMVTLMSIPALAAANNSYVNIWNYGEIRATSIWRNGDIFVSNRDVINIFPDETRNMYFAQYTETSSLWNWTSSFGYSYTIEDHDVYLYKNEYSYRTNLSVYLDGSYVSGTSVYTDYNNSSTVYTDITSLEKIFPRFAGWFYNNNSSNSTLNYWASQLNYTLSISGNRVDLRPNGNWKYLDVYVNNSYVRNTSVYTMNNSSTVYTDRTSLEKIFPNNTRIFSTNNNGNYTLNYWASQVGYTISVSGNRVNLYSGGSNRNNLSVYLDGSYVSGTSVYTDYNSSTVYTDIASLEKIFPRFAGWFYNNNSSNSTLNYWASQLNYTLSISGNRVDLRANGNRTNLSVYVNGNYVSNTSVYNINGSSTVYTDRTSLEKIFPNNTRIFSTNNNGNYTLNYWANQMGYSLNVYGNRVDLTNSYTAYDPYNPYNQYSQYNPYNPAQSNGQYTLVINGCVTNIRPYLRNVGSAQEIHVTDNESKQIFDKFNVSMTVNLPTEIRSIAARCGMDCTVYGRRVYFHWENCKPIEVSVNGTPVDFTDIGPVVKDGRTLLPVRAVSNALGASVQWNSYDQSVDIVKDQKTITLTIGSYNYWVNGGLYYLDVPPEIINNRTMLPIRLIAENLGYVVSWDGSQAVNVVNITSFNRTW